MAAVLALPDEKVEEICASIEGEVVVCANYNCPGQLVISGSVPGIDAACEKMLAAGAKRALKLKVGGAFHYRSDSDPQTVLPCLPKRKHERRNLP